MRGFHFYHAHRSSFHFSDFWLYEISMWLHTLARSLVAIFIPILMLKSGYDVRDVILFFLAFNVMDVPLNLAARGFIRRFGARFAIVVATCVTIGFSWMLLHLGEPTMFTLLGLALFSALYDSLYWVAHFFLFIESGSKGAAKSTGSMYAVRQAAIILGPAVGAAILIFSSQQILLYVTIFGFLLSLVPLLLLTGLPDKPRGRPLAYKEFFALPEGKRVYLSSAFYGVHDTVETHLFPLFIFLIFGTLESVALIPVLVSLAAILTAFMLGRIKSSLRTTAVTVGALAIAAVWIVRLLTTDPTIYYASVLVVSVCAYFILVPLDSTILEYAKRMQDPLSASTYRNIAYMSTNIFIFGALALLINVFEPSFAIATASLFALGVIHLIPARFLFRKTSSR